MLQGVILTQHAYDTWGWVGGGSIEFSIAAMYKILHSNQSQIAIDMYN